MRNHHANVKVASTFVNYVARGIPSPLALVRFAPRVARIYARRDVTGAASLPLTGWAIFTARRRGRGFPSRLMETTGANGNKKHRPPGGFGSLVADSPVEIAIRSPSRISSILAAKFPIGSLLSRTFVKYILTDFNLSISCIRRLRARRLRFQRIRNSRARVSCRHVCPGILMPA